MDATPPAEPAEPAVPALAPEPAEPGSTPGVCDVSDACDRLGVTAVRCGAIRPAFPTAAPVTGILTTLALEPGTGPVIADVVRALDRVATPILLVDLGGRTDLQCWGSLLAVAARRLGVSGAVVNGAVRDVAGLAELDFPTFCRGVHPAAAGGRVRLRGVGVDARIDGQRVPSGWAVAADADGAVFWPGERMPEVLRTAATLAGADEVVRDRLAAAAGAAEMIELLRRRS